jgi:L-lactate dehydrogenase complex protein LldG
MAEISRTDARLAIFRQVRAALQVRGDEPGRRGLVQSRLRSPQPNLIPERALRPRGELIKLFQTMLEKAGAKVSRVRAHKGLPEAIAIQLRENGLPPRVRIGTDPMFGALMADPNGLEILQGPAQADDPVGLSHAAAGAAETGTLFLASGPENPSTLNFLPETHQIVILANDIAGSYEEGWAKLRSIYGAGNMPRTVNLISGPSRTADIEQTIIMGAHGPRNLLVLIAGS